MTALHERDGDAPSDNWAPTRVGVVGFGYWGVNYVRVFSEMPDAHLSVVCDERPERVAEAKRRFPEIDLAVDVDRLFDDPDIEALVVATPATTHYELARRALLA